MVKAPFAISGERAVISTGGACNHQCEYCFVTAGDYRIPAKISTQTIIDTVKTFPSSVERIELGLDTDPMLDQPRALDLISRLGALGKDVSFATKADLTVETVGRLSEIANLMAEQGNFLFTKVSLMGFKTAQAYEPGAPSPERRVDTIKRLHAAGLPNIVYVKPILPTLPDKELERVFEETQGHVYAYIAGYLIYDEMMAHKLSIKVSEEQMKMEWDPSQRNWSIYRDPRIEELIQRENVFKVSANAIAHVKNIFKNK
jgi:DNA repair photolyase